MEQLILRQAAIDGLRDYLVGKRCPDDGTLTCRLIENEVINKLPPIQPDIVRCKDCKYAEYIDDVQTLWCTECGQGRTVAPYDFCSYGERRDDG